MLCLRREVTPGWLKTLAVQFVDQNSLPPVKAIQRGRFKVQPDRKDLVFSSRKFCEMQRYGSNRCKRIRVRNLALSTDTLCGPSLQPLLRTWVLGSHGREKLWVFHVVKYLSGWGQKTKQTLEERETRTPELINSIYMCCACYVSLATLELEFAYEYKFYDMTSTYESINIHSFF